MRAGQGKVQRVGGEEEENLVEAKRTKRDPVSKNEGRIKSHGARLDTKQRAKVRTRRQLTPQRTIRYSYQSRKVPHRFRFLPANLQLSKITSVSAEYAAACANPADDLP